MKQKFISSGNIGLQLLLLHSDYIIIEKSNLEEVEIVGKITGTSGVNRRRMGEMLVNRNTAINRSSRVESVDPVHISTNSTSYRFENFLMYSEWFYDKIERLKREYTNYFHSHQNLKKAIQNWESGHAEFFDKTGDLIDKYNSSVTALRGFDTAFNTDFSKDVDQLVKKYQKQFINLGLGINDNGTIDFDSRLFSEKVNHSSDAVKELLGPLRAFILQVYKLMRSIKASKTDSEYGYPYPDSGETYQGLLLDRER